MAAALVMACESPTHHDGDAIRCRGQERSMRMFGIDAPEMPGACRPGRQCTPGDPYAARDHLRSLTQGRRVVCEEKDIDSFGRPVVRCAADGEDLSCAMVKAGYAVERYGRLNCDDLKPLPEVATPPQPQGPQRYFAPADAPVTARNSGRLWLLGGTWLLALNILGWVLIATDQKRGRSGEMRIPDQLLLIVAALGGGGGVLAAQQLLDHKSGEQPFSNIVLLITGLELGLIAGLAALSLV
jgi:endonuclease YncB( thermonuclease family)/uncharacterized membrane protein YsdA (DUF1294 family)